ncbi:MAG: hypothetical protein KME52_16770 [Desmonostoc geniculatum HA4340-LM1]|jgi:hypothetical protein|nr:hypothetical protein [Desmonostoc geniculatum HA4340-LM1]
MILSFPGSIWECGTNGENEIGANGNAKSKRPQYGLVNAPDAINRRQDKDQSFVLTAIYRVFGSRIFIKKP